MLVSDIFGLIGLISLAVVFLSVVLSIAFGEENKFDSILAVAFEVCGLVVIISLCAGFIALFFEHKTGRQTLLKQDTEYALEIAKEFNLADNEALGMVFGVRNYLDNFGEVPNNKNEDLIEVVDDKVAVDLNTGVIYEASYTTMDGFETMCSITWCSTGEQYENIELLREIVNSLN